MRGLLEVVRDSFIEIRFHRDRTYIVSDALESLYRSSIGAYNPSCFKQSAVEDRGWPFRLLRVLNGMVAVIRSDQIAFV